LAHLNGAGTAPDTLYITDSVSNSAAGQIDKYSLVGGTWVQTGSFSVGPGVTGLTGVVNGANVNLYGTAAGSSGTAGPLYIFTCSTGYNGTVSGAATAIATASSNEAFRGIAFAPTAVASSAPTVTPSGPAASYTAGAAAVTVDSGITVTNSGDSNKVSSATVV